LEAVSAVPSHADSLPGLPQSHVGADRVDTSGNFVARDSGILETRPEPFLHQRIAVTNAARLDLDAHLTAGGLGDWALDDFEISTGFADLHCFHRRFSRKQAPQNAIDS
jgi:hypothetical protein